MQEVINLVPATVEDAELLHKLQREAFMIDINTYIFML